MKSSIHKYILGAFLVSLVFACSVKKDRFINRNLHAVSTEYNILYNGNIALDAGLEEVKSTFQDNFWDVLTVERMPKKDENILPGQSKNSNFEKAEEKAVKAIQKHSMNIDGTERNPQIDEAYLLLGKARYFDNRFIPALESFNYILYKYPKSDKIYHAKVWREKVNIRLDNNEVAIKNLKQLLKSQNIEGQDLADANAMLAQAFINIEVLDTAVASLKIAKEETKNKEEQARYTFILGQIYEKMNYQDSAFAAFQEVIDMKRKSPRRYVIQAHAKQALQFDYEKGDTIAFLEKFNKLIEDRENRPYLDIIYHQMGIFYDNFEKDSIAESYYNKSNRRFSQDTYLTASNYRNIGEIHFKNADYKVAGMYYDSTLLKMNERTREYRKIKKKRENLIDVIKYEDIAKQNDSILSLVAMNEGDRKIFFEKYIEKLKKEDELKAKLAAEKDAKDQQDNMPGKPKFNPNPDPINISGGNLPPIGMNSQSTFYFYNPTTVAYGIKEFQKKWGNRKPGSNWRQSKAKEDFLSDDYTNEDFVEVENDSVKEINPAYTVAFYTEQLPKEKKEIDSISKERNNAYYELGLLYKEKFKEYALSANRFEKLLTFNPEERLILPTKYYLYKDYEVIDPDKAKLLKAEILANYPDSRYAQIILNPKEAELDSENPEAVFKNIYNQLEKGQIREAYAQINERVEMYFGDEILPKMELLRAKVIARTNGLEAYKKALNEIAVAYQNISEGKQAQELLNKDIPVLESIAFSDEDKLSWKILFPKTFEIGKTNEKLVEKLAKYVKDSHNDDLKLSVDFYNLDNDFIVLHGFKSKETAQAVLLYLKENKEYKVKDEAFVISSDNYRVVQVKKQFQEWLNIQ
ncbi:tetratricopeptide repeat protein [Flavobacterium okayamense]|uniref:Gliding motility protein n=1 Tax=Flavobacterium okayamense TaxID=2830782 RepID=A0ABN6HYF8_9FLAO|nr:gliding motility protein [Flavobacterium okayamense]BCY27947.1 gliding motility protein [Flavobacterium okayamense]